MCFLRCFDEVLSLISFDVSGFGVFLLMAQLLVSQGLISDPLSRVLEDSGDN